MDTSPNNAPKIKIEKDKEKVDTKEGNLNHTYHRDNPTEIPEEGKNMIDHHLLTEKTEKEKKGTPAKKEEATTTVTKMTDTELMKDHPGILLLITTTTKDKEICTEDNRLRCSAEWVAKPMKSTEDTNTVGTKDLEAIPMNDLRGGTQGQDPIVGNVFSGTRVVGIGIIVEVTGGKKKEGVLTTGREVLDVVPGTVLGV